MEEEKMEVKEEGRKKNNLRVHGGIDECSIQKVAIPKN